MKMPVYRLIEKVGSASITHCPEPPRGEPKYCILNAEAQQVATAFTLAYARREAGKVTT